MKAYTCNIMFCAIKLHNVLSRTALTLWYPVVLKSLSSKFGKVVKVFFLFKVCFFSGKLKFLGIVLSLILTFQNISDSSTDLYRVSWYAYTVVALGIFFPTYSEISRSRTLVLN